LHALRCYAPRHAGNLIIHQETTLWVLLRLDRSCRRSQSLEWPSGGGVSKATAFEGRAKRQWRVCNELPTELDSSPEQKEAHDRLKGALHDVERATPSTGIEAMIVQVAENYGAPLDNVGFDLQFVIEETMFALAKDVSRHLSAWAGHAPGLFSEGNGDDLGG
jgi:hypothetical protein